jgi:hypothetical protein
MVGGQGLRQDVPRQVLPVAYNLVQEGITAAPALAVSSSLVHPAFTFKPTLKLAC